MKNKQVVFAIGTGRCGTKFISELLKLQPNMSYLEVINCFIIFRKNGTSNIEVNAWIK